MADDMKGLLGLMRRRRSVRRFEPGRSVPRETLERIAEAARWAPTGANSQCFDLLVVDDAATRDAVLEVFLAQSQRLIAHVKGFPAVKKTYMQNTAAIFIVLGDPRWKAAFPKATSPEWEAEYAENNEKIYLVSLGAVVQNIQLAVTACGLTSAWLSGGGETTTNEALRAVLGYPETLEAVATIPVGVPEKDVALRYRRPLGQMLHFNRYDTGKYRPDSMIDFYVERLRPFAMYRGSERMEEWDDLREKAGGWAASFTSDRPSPPE